MALFVVITLIAMTHACVTQLTDKQDYRFFIRMPTAVINKKSFLALLRFGHRAILIFLGIETWLGGYLEERKSN